MPEVTVDVQVWCSCGEGLCHQSEGRAGGVIVEPCEKCLNAAKEEAYNEGYEDAKTE